MATDLEERIRRTEELFGQQVDLRLQEQLRRLESYVAPSSAANSKLLDALEFERARREAKRLIDAEECIATDLPEILSLSQRLMRPRDALRFRIDGWQVKDSRIVLSAQFKAGKTTIRDNLVRSLVDGDPFLGEFPVSPIEGSVVLLDFEMGERQLDDWLACQRIQNRERLFVASLRGRVGTFDIVSATTRANWIERLRAVRGAYLILDCLRPVLDALGLDENHDVGRFLIALDSLLQGAGITECLVVHHMGHLGERARGDSRLRDWPDTEWRLVRQDGNPGSPRFLSAYGRDVDQHEQGLTYDLSSRRLALSGGSRHELRNIAALKAISGVLDARPRQSGRAIKHALTDCGLSRDCIDEALRFGVRSGVLRAGLGPRRAKLYELSVSECTPVSAACPSRPPE